MNHEQMKTYKAMGHDGREYGPADLTTIRAWVAEGRIAASTKIQAEGTTEWRPASAFPELGLEAATTWPPSSPEVRQSPAVVRPKSSATSHTLWMVWALATVLVAAMAIAWMMTATRNDSSNAQVLTPAPLPPSPVRSGEETPRGNAAEPGDAEAQYRLAKSYFSGVGVGKDYDKAAKWYRQAAALGHTQAQYELGLLYAQGLGVGRDFAQATRLYRLAADKGYAPAQHSLGHLYASGQGLDTESLEAPEPPRRATPGQQVLRSDYAEAAKWWRKAAEQGDAQAQSDLGWLYKYGRGVETNYAQAVAWYRKSAEQGNPAAQHWLGHFFLSGMGITKDEAEAFRWFHEAADKGITAAQGDVARLYAKGRGVEQNSTEAIKWYRKAAEAGLPTVQNDFAWMLATSTNASLRDGALAVVFAEKAVSATRRGDAGFLDTLAAAHAEVGDFEKAVAIQSEALALLKDATSKQDYASRLQLYKAKTPYREVEKE